MPCDTPLHRVVKRYIDEGVALETESRTTDEHMNDTYAVLVAGDGGGDLPDRGAACMEKWLKIYGVLQGIKKCEREQISTRVVGFYQCEEQGIPDDLEYCSECRIEMILKKYKTLNQIVRCSRNEKIQRRSFLSLTSKALWCKYPSIIPIYDSYVSRAAYMISKIENIDGRYNPKKHDYQPPKGQSPKNQSPKELRANKLEADCVAYEIFIRNYLPLYDKVRQKISERLPDTGSPKAIRVFDKILWLYGSMANDIPHRRAVYKRWEAPPP